MKTCSKCGSSKKLSEFHKDKSALDGCTSQCSDCRNSKRRVAKHDALRRVFIWPDTHAPWHNEKSVKVALSALTAFAPDDLAILGDFGDFYAVSRHSKSPTRLVRFTDEIRSVRKLLQKVKTAAGDARCHFIAGNHEVRLVKYLKDRAPELFELISIPQILGLSDRGYTYTPYGDYITIGKLALTHDIGHSGMSAHRQSLNKAGMSIVIGHTHRMASVTEKQLMTQEVISGTMCGWLGSEELMLEYMPKASVRRYAVQGFAVAYILPDGTPDVRNIPILGGSCVIEGTVIKG